MLGIMGFASGNVVKFIARRGRNVARCLLAVFGFRFLQVFLFRLSPTVTGDGKGGECHCTCTAQTTVTSSTNLDDDLMIRTLRNHRTIGVGTLRSLFMFCLRPLAQHRSSQQKKARRPSETDQNKPVSPLTLCTCTQSALGQTMWALGMGLYPAHVVTQFQL